MGKTRQKLLSAALELFVVNGYELTTTKEIAKLADVAEVTLFRHFTSKSNLFVETLNDALVDFIKIEEENMYALRFRDFFQNLLHQKLLLASRNKKLLQMLIRENSYGNIPENLKIIYEIQRQSAVTFAKYLSFHDNEKLDSKYLTNVFIGIIIRYVLLDEYTYHELSAAEQAAITLSYAKTLTDY